MLYHATECVVLTRDLPDAGLKSGDLGTIVEVLPPDAYEVEFLTISGRTGAVVTINGDDLRRGGDTDLHSVRTFKPAR
jgi:hypothetical protein